MIHFGKISQQEFLRDYWQKKPLLIKQALPDFISPLSPDELILLMVSIKNIVIHLKLRYLTREMLIPYLLNSYVSFVFSL